MTAAIQHRTKFYFTHFSFFLRLHVMPFLVWIKFWFIQFSFKDDLMQTTDLNCFSFRRRYWQDNVVLFIVEFDALDVIKNTEKMCLDRVRITCLAKDFKQRRIRNKEETGKQESLLLQITAEQKASCIKTWTISLRPIRRSHLNYKF